MEATVHSANLPYVSFPWKRDHPESWRNSSQMGWNKQIWVMQGVDASGRPAQTPSPGPSHPCPHLLGTAASWGPPQGRKAWPLASIWDISKESNQPRGSLWEWLRPVLDAAQFNFTQSCLPPSLQVLFLRTFHSKPPTYKSPSQYLFSWGSQHMTSNITTFSMLISKELPF